MEELVGIIVGGITMMIPIVYILTKHQQKMALIMRQDQTAGNSGDVQRELAALRELVSQQTIAIDSISRSQAELGAQLSRQELQERVR